MLSRRSSADFSIFTPIWREMSLCKSRKKHLVNAHVHGLPGAENLALQPCARERRAKLKLFFVL